MRAKWSTGCYTCRRRKVKVGTSDSHIHHCMLIVVQCDDAKPECMKCQRSGRVCAGYRTTEQLIFRSMNTSVVAKTNIHTITNALTPITSAYGTRASFASTSSILYTQPSTDWEQCAIGRFLAHFVETPSDATSGYLEFLPQMLKWSFESTRNALLAISLANLANVSGKRDLGRKSKVHYGRALRSLQVALNARETVAADNTLVNVVLLQMYEVGYSAKQMPFLCCLALTRHRASLGRQVRPIHTTQQQQSYSVFASSNRALLK